MVLVGFMSWIYLQNLTQFTICPQIYPRSPQNWDILPIILSWLESWTVNEE